MINCSIVLYNHTFNQLSQLVETLNTIELVNKIYLLNNSKVDLLCSQFSAFSKVVYIFNHDNLGYGKAHNIAIKQSVQNVNYHIVLNPDLEITEEAVINLKNFMDSTQNIGLVMPKVLYPDGSVQFLCKMMPTPFDLIGRRFLPGFLKSLFNNRLNLYELKHKDYNQTMEIPNLSGCFMFLRCSALQTVGMFDPKFFMYLEDTDLSRRINQQYQTIYYPEVSIIHHYEKGSYKNFKLLTYHIKSAFYYFTKWGWLFDPMRSTINKLLAH